MNLRNVGEYNIGLDIGTGSVGWAVIDSDGEICHFKGKPTWGSRLSLPRFQHQKREFIVGNDVATLVVSGAYLFYKSCLRLRLKLLILISLYA